MACAKSHNDVLIDALQSEIVFLRNEMASKDTIIKLLINERNDINSRDNKLIEKKAVTQSSVESKKKHDVQKNSLKHDATRNNNAKKDNINRDIVVGVDQHDEFANDGFQQINAKGNKRSITIMGDSMIKELKPHLMRNYLRSKNGKLYVHSFSGATTKQMEHYSKPPMAYKPDLVILHTGTNSLRGESTPEEVADVVIDLATNFKTDHNEIVISEIIASRDQVNEKAVRVNHFLRMKTTELGIGYISHENINTDMHLNPKGLHLNHKGSILLSRNFIK